jgi:hypothetical protein
VPADHLHMSTTAALGQYRVTTIRIPRSTDNGLWAALAARAASDQLADLSAFRHMAPQPGVAVTVAA